MMTLAIALTTHDDRTLEPGPTRYGAFLDNLPTNRRAPANEARIKASGTTAIMFGAFCLVPMQRLLLEASQPVHLGSRALDILIALVERHGEAGHQERTDIARLAGHCRGRDQCGSPYLRVAAGPARRSGWKSLPHQHSQAGLLLCSANLDHRGAAAHVVMGPGDGRRFRHASDAHATDRKRRRNQEACGGASPGFGIWARSGLTNGL